MEESVLREAIRPVDPSVADEALAVGVFGLKDDYAAITVGGAVAGSLADAVVPNGGPLVDGVAGAAGMHAAREVNAERHGVTVQMVVAVTPNKVLIFDYNHGTVTRCIHVFDRLAMNVSIKPFGLSRRVEINDMNFRIELTGTTAFYSSVSAGDKHVLSELSK